MKQRIIIAMLRRPRKNGKDTRTDPFWEFGSFGLTGCHNKNLLHLKNINEIAGCRLAFAQGGPDAIKLILVTPPIRVINHARKQEALWDKTVQPLRYVSAPTIIKNNGWTEFPELLNEFLKVKRPSLMGKFASKFRTRTKPISDKAALELAYVFEKYRLYEAKTAKYYTETLPFLPGKIDHNRQETYAQLLKIAQKI